MNNEKEIILQKCLDCLENHQSYDDILSQYQGDKDEIESLIRIAEELGNLPSPEPTVKSLMKTMASLAVKEKSRKTIKFFSKYNLFRLAACFLMFFFIMQVTVYSSADSNPGDFLYPLKLFTEKVKFLLTFNESKKVELHITYSDERLKELLKNYDKGDGLDKNLLKEMLFQAQQALETGNELPQKNKLFLLKRIKSLCHFQQQILSNLKNEIKNPREKELLMNCSDICAERCRKIQQSCQDSLKTKNHK